MTPGVGQNSLVDRSATRGYWYLGSPYSHPDPAIREARWHEVKRASHWLLSRRVWVYSPIMHTHQLVIDHALPFEFEFWNEYNQAMLRASLGMLVLVLDGCATSRGLQAEAEFCNSNAIPVFTLSSHSDGGYESQALPCR